MGPERLASSLVSKRVSLSKLEWLAAVTITALSVCLHLMRFLKAGPLWRDEVAALNLARMPWRDLVHYFPHEAFPLLFPTGLRGYTSIAGTSDVALRFLGSATGVSCIVALWIIARLLRQRTPLLSLILIGLNPVFFVWGDSIRGYGAATAAIILTFGLFARAIILPSLSTFALCLCGAIVSAQFLVANSALLFAIGMAAILVWLWPRRFGLVAIVLSIGLITA